jgi:hypothetical protein
MRRGDDEGCACRDEGVTNDGRPRGRLVGRTRHADPDLDPGLVQ